MFHAIKPKKKEVPSWTSENIGEIIYGSDGVMYYGNDTEWLPFSIDIGLRNNETLVIFVHNGISVNLKLHSGSPKVRVSAYDVIKTVAGPSQNLTYYMSLDGNSWTSSMTPSAAYVDFDVSDVGIHDLYVRVTDDEGNDTSVQTFAYVTNRYSYSEYVWSEDVILMEAADYGWFPRIASPNSGSTLYIATQDWETSSGGRWLLHKTTNFGQTYSQQYVSLLSGTNPHMWWGGIAAPYTWLLYMSCNYESNLWTERVMFAFSYDDGYSWTPVHVDTLDGTETSVGEYLTMTVVDGNNVYLAYNVYHPSYATHVRVAKTTNGGSSWDFYDVEQRVYETRAWFEYHHCDALDANHFALVYHEQDVDSNMHLSVQYTSDGGANWNKRYIVETTDAHKAPGYSPKVKWVDENTIYVVHEYWSMYYGEPTNYNCLCFHKSTDGGDTWSDPVVIDSSPTTYGFYVDEDAVSLFVRNGVIYVTQSVNNYGPMDPPDGFDYEGFSVYTSSDAGDTWSTLEERHYSGTSDPYHWFSSNAMYVNTDSEIFIALYDLDYLDTSTYALVMIGYMAMEPI